MARRETGLGFVAGLVDLSKIARVDGAAERTHLPPSNPLGLAV